MIGTCKDESYIAANPKLVERESVMRISSDNPTH
jgi:hypothetical protein